MLIIEDGSIVPSANSYVTLTEIKDYADLRNIEYGCDSDLATSAIRATDYLESKCYKGEFVNAETQPLSWPRKYAYIRNVEFPNDAIPQQLKDAQCELALSGLNTDLLSDGTVDASVGGVKRRKTDVLEVEYFESTTGSSTSFNSQSVNSYLRHLIKPIGLVRV